MQLSLKQKLIGACLSAVLLMAAFLTWLAVSQIQAQTQSSIYSRVSGIADAATESISGWVQIRADITGAFTDYTSSSRRVSYLQQAREAGGFDDIYFGTPKGAMYRSRPERNRDDYDPRVRPWYKQAVSAGSPIITTAYSDAITGAMLVTLAEPVRRNGELIGVVGADVLIDQLIRDVTQLKVGKNANAMLLGDDGTFLAHKDKARLLKPYRSLSPELNENRVRQALAQQSLVELPVDGVDKLFYFASVPNTDWVLAIELDKRTEYASQRDTLFDLMLTAVVITLLVAGAVTWLMHVLFRDLLNVSAALEEIASGEGDLTQRLEPHSNDEIGKLANNFNRFVGNMHTMVSHLRQLSGSLKQQAELTAAQAEERSTRIGHQQDEINMVATAIHEMASATQDIAGNADNTAHTAQETESVANDGGQQVEQSKHSITELAREVEAATGVIGELDQHAHSITSILSTIQEVAEQTNLLALNAAIEAARAGEHGRGFAVVADEVRILSQRTHASTTEIQQMIDTLQQATGRAVTMMQDSQQRAHASVEDASAANESLSQIVAAVSQISDMATQIASAAEEQSSVTAEITRNSEGIRDVSNELSTEADEAARQAATLSELSHSLEQEISRFKL